MQASHLNRTRTLTLSGFLFIGLLSGALHAQESQALETVANTPEASEKEVKPIPVEVPVSDAATESEDEMLFLMDDFVVSAEDDQGYYSANTLAGTRTNELTKNIPMTISTVNQEMLQDFGLNTLGDLGNLVPSIEWEGNSYSNSEIRFRGFLSKNQLYEFMPRYSPVDYYNIQRADIIRGANSLIYGQADPGGKINLISKTANFSKNVTQYSLEIGNQDSIRHVLDINRVISDNAAVRVMATDKYKEFNQDYKYDDFRGVTLEAMMKVGKKTNLRLHLENTYSKKPRLNNAFQDGTSQSGFTGMPHNIVADPKIADLMSDDLVNYIVDYNDPENGNILRSQYPNLTVASDPDRVGRTGLLIPDYFSGDTMEEKRASIRDFYAGIDSQNTGALTGPDAYQENKGNYVIGEISHVINDSMQLKVAISGEKLNGYSRTRGAANTLKHSLGYLANINLPYAPGNSTYDDWDANGDQNKEQLGARIGLYGDVQALRDDAANFESNVQSSIGRFWVTNMTVSDAIDTNGNNIADTNAEKDAKIAELAQSIASDLQTYLAGGALENASQTEFQQALEDAVTDYTEQVVINGNTATRGFVNSRIDELFAEFPTNDPVNEDGSINPAVGSKGTRSTPALRCALLAGTGSRRQQYLGPHHLELGTERRLYPRQTTIADWYRRRPARGIAYAIPAVSTRHHDRIQRSRHDQ
jgi:outer membrane receptor protein involved in Fe transport